MSMDIICACQSQGPANYSLYFPRTVYLILPSVNFSERERDRDDLQSQISELARENAEQLQDVRSQLQREREEREKEAKSLEEHFRYLRDASTSLV